VERPLLLRERSPHLPGAYNSPGPAGHRRHRADGMRLAAEHGDFWVTTGLTTTGRLGPVEGAAVVAAQVRRLEDACHQVGRTPRRCASSY